MRDAGNKINEGVEEVVDKGAEMADVAQQKGSEMEEGSHNLEITEKKA